MSGGTMPSMKAAPPMKFLPIGTVAARLGLTIRALRLYEAEGLLSPERSAAGRRVYQAADLTRLQQIIALKKTGCSLAQIRDLLALRTLDPATLLDSQIEALQKQKVALDGTLDRLRAARARLVDGQPIELGELCDLINLGEWAMTPDGWQEVFDRYYTPEEQERWKQAKLHSPDIDGVAMERAWPDLIGRVEAAMAQDAKPQEEASMALAKEWYALQQPMVDKIGVETWNKGARLFEEMDQWQTDQVRSPFSKEVYQFILAAAECARERGLIPPRMSNA
jgi:DNA-binding transcriptional MerR regulator